ncbi:MAG: aminotransferase class I/II-fold pyridoxal phosphate-dependent enzyme [Proteobacteria bacterium]|nr:aminotransferase class I/II-fold pyridoxal phosphate-dependent enzyme [Pseudomonadota bacterium]MCP4916286.1 aminotransferase class I/II-fold pyridoxal phosphate-dependent enzyme [Pseudomonadota bacterium]
MRLNPVFTQLGTYPQIALDRKKAEVRAAGKTVFDFGTGDPVEPTPEPIRQALINSVPKISQYPKVQGSAAFRASVASYLDRRFGVTADPDTQILPTSGSKEAVFHLPFLTIDPATEDNLVVFPDPGYPAYDRGALFAGGRPWMYRMEGGWKQRLWEVPGEVLRRTRLMWINTPHNPSGAVMSLDDLKRTYDVCREYDILLASDECYCDVYDGEPPASLQQVADEGYLCFHSLSKRSGMTGVRSGFISGDPKWVQAYRQFRINPGLVPQDTVNAGATVAWQDDEHADSRRALLKRKKDMFRAFCADVGLEIIASQATFYFWLKTPEGIDDEAYALRLLDAGIVVSPGRYFGKSGVGKGYIRVAMVPTIETLPAALEAWRAVHQEEGWTP